MNKKFKIHYRVQYKSKKAKECTYIHGVNKFLELLNENVFSFSLLRGLHDGTDDINVHVTIEYNKHIKETPANLVLILTVNDEYLGLFITQDFKCLCTIYNDDLKVSKESLKRHIAVGRSFDLNFIWEEYLYEYEESMCINDQSFEDWLLNNYKSSELNELLLEIYNHILTKYDTIEDIDGLEKHTNPSSLINN